MTCLQNLHFEAKFCPCSVRNVCKFQFCDRWSEMQYPNIDNELFQGQHIKFSFKGRQL